MGHMHHGGHWEGGHCRVLQAMQCRRSHKELGLHRAHGRGQVHMLRDILRGQEQVLGVEPLQEQLLGQLQVVERVLDQRWA